MMMMIIIIIYCECYKYIKVRKE